MAESTLTLTRQQLKEALGEYLGISRTLANWTATAAADVDRILGKGLRSFYSPLRRTNNPNAPLVSHQWSFLRKRLSLSVTSATNAFDLPDDFAGLLDRDEAGRHVLAFTTSKDWPLLVVPVWRVLEKIQAGTTPPTGITQPLLAAVEAKSFTASTGQRWQLRVWPTIASGTLTVTGDYRSQPDFISNDAYYPLGGELHAETLLEACLAAAEAFQNDSATLHRERFQQLLEASIAADRELHETAA